ncbi:MAG: WD40/YVTN/BNR-like repeat-containing protein [Aggregatilineales bacterium]
MKPYRWLVVAIVAAVAIVGAVELFAAAHGSNTNNVPAGSVAAGNASLSPNQSVGLAYDPADGSLLKADASGLQRWTSDAGWKSINAPQSSNLTTVVVNPTDPKTLYVSGPGFGIARSSDGGTSWQMINNGLPALNVTALALHAFNLKTLFAWIGGQGVYRTDDAGDLWKQVPDQGPPDTNVYAMVFSTLPGSMQTGWLYASTPTGLYISMDCFCGWRTMTSLSTTNPTLHSVAIDPKTPQNVYAAGASGLFRSADGGLTWKEADQGFNGKPLAVTLVHDQPQTIYALLADDSVWRSIDGAVGWQLLKSGS